MSNKIKQSWRMSRPEIANLLHRLADSLETGAETVDGFDLHLVDDGEYKIRFNLEKDALLAVKFTAKGARAEIARSAGDPPPCVQSTNFSAAKRVMQTSFKAVSGSLNRGKLPTPESMDDYLSSSMAMCTGQTESEYAIFASLCEKLRVAYDAADLAAVTAIVQEMIAAKKECHKRLA